MNMELVTVREAKRMLSLSKGMVYKLIASGKIPSYRFGTAVRLRLADVIDAARVHPPDKSASTPSIAHTAATGRPSGWAQVRQRCLDRERLEGMK